MIRSGRICDSQAAAGASRPWSWARTRRTPRAPWSRVPSAACCHSARNSRNRAALTGADSRRSPARVNRWIRASTRRWHHSTGPPAAAGVPKRPCSTAPSASRRPRAAATLSSGSASPPARAAAVAGPEQSITPRRTAATAPARVSGTVAGSAAGAGAGASGHTAWASASRSTPTQRRASPTPNAAARPADSSSRNHPDHSGRSRMAPRVSRASCNSSASRTVGAASAAALRIASGSRTASGSSAGGSALRIRTARARRSSSGAGSRKAKGLAFRISAANGDGSVVSTASVRTAPLPMSSSSFPRLSRSIASRRQSEIASSTSGCFGIRTSPARFSAQAAWSGNTAASRSSASIRWMGGGTRPPLRRLGTASAREAVQRQRTPNSGTPRSACVSTGSSVCGLRNRNTEASGKEWRSVSEMTMPSSVAAACSSRLKERQKRFRSARPQARLIRLPKGAWRTSCIPPESSKNRSATTVRRPGSAPRAARPAAR